MPQPRRKPKPKTIAEYKVRVAELEQENQQLKTSQTSLGGPLALETTDLMEEAWRELQSYLEELEGIRDGVDGLLAHDAPRAGGGTDPCGGDLVLLTLDRLKGATVLVCSQCGRVEKGGFGLTIDLDTTLPARLDDWARRQGLTWTR